MTYSRAISVRMISTRSILAAASPARALVPIGHSRDRSATTFCSSARASSTDRINATRRAIRRGFPSDIAKISAATISAADSSDIVSSRLRLENDKQTSLRPEGITHGQAMPRKGKSASFQSVKHFDHKAEKAGSCPAPLCCTNPITGGTPSQGGRNPFGLPVSFAFAARRPGQPLTRADLHPPRKVDVKNVAHSSVLYPVAALVERHPVSAT